MKLFYLLFATLSTAIALYSLGVIYYTTLVHNNTPKNIPKPKPKTEQNQIFTQDTPTQAHINSSIQKKINTSFAAFGALSKQSYLKNKQIYQED